MTKSFTLAVDVGGSHIAVALVSDDGIQAIQKFEVSAGKGLRGYLGQIEQAAKELFIEIPQASGDCHGVGMAVPLLVNAGTARVVSSPRGKFEDATAIDFRAWASERFQLPIYLEVDAHAGCFGEWVSGAGQGCDDLVYVTLGTGYGTSVILRGRLLRGRTSQAGILGGHLSVNAGGHQCVCPGRGCIEAETGTWALNGIIREHPQYRASRLAKHESVDYRTLFAEADAGDSLAKETIARNLAYWGASMVNLTHAYNPAKIVLAGSVLREADRIIPFMNDYVHRNAWTASDYPSVVPAKHYETAVLLGLHALFTTTAERL
ncbi:MAG: ROK family protein [Verrucomicrobiota bacterium]